MLLFILLIGAFGGVSGNFLTTYFLSSNNSNIGCNVSKVKIGEYNATKSNQ